MSISVLRLVNGGQRHLLKPRRSSGGSHLLGIAVRCSEYFAAITRSFAVMGERQVVSNEIYWEWIQHDISSLKSKISMFLLSLRNPCDARSSLFIQVVVPMAFLSRQHHPPTSSCLSHPEPAGRCWWIPPTSRSRPSAPSPSTPAPSTAGGHGMVRQAYAWMYSLHKKVVEFLVAGAVYQDMSKERPIQSSQQKDNLQVLSQVMASYGKLYPHLWPMVFVAINDLGRTSTAKLGRS